MTIQILPLDNSPNQTLETNINVDGGVISLELCFTWNAIAGYWVMKIIDSVTGTTLLDSIPLVPGNYPAGNILGQYAYLKIGSAYIVNVANSELEWPDNKTLGTDWILAWDDTPGYSA